jgi:heat shock protein HtpX
MWDAIEQNKRRSWILIGVMAFLLAAFGYAIGGALYLEFAMPRDWVRGIHDYAGSVDRFADGDPDALRQPRFFAWLDRPGQLLNKGGLAGVACGLGIAALMGLNGWFLGARSLLRTAGAIPIDKQHAPQLYNVVEEMTIAAGLPKMPEVYVIDDDAPNAFATGRSPNEAAVAVTRGLLSRLNRDELQGVIAHEIGHVRNLDIRFMTLAGTILGSIVLISELYLRSLWYAPRRSSSSRGKGGGAQAILFVVAIVLAILAPIFAQMLYFACSRRREYLADATAAELTRYPEGLASALEKIGAAAPMRTEACSKTLAPMFIVNPLQAHGTSSVFASHPPLTERVKILRGMGGMAGYVDYEAAYARLRRGRHCMSEAFLKEQRSMPARRPTAQAESRGDAIARVREAMGLMDAAAGVLPIVCSCGVRIKLPPGLAATQVACPRCGTLHEPAHAVAEGGEQPDLDAPVESKVMARPAKPMVYRRRSGGWESFRCGCGYAIELSPQFSAPQVHCNKCGSRIRIEEQA